MTKYRAASFLAAQTEAHPKIFRRAVGALLRSLCRYPSTLCSTEGTRMPSYFVQPQRTAEEQDERCETNTPKRSARGDISVPRGTKRKHFSFLT